MLRDFADLAVGQLGLASAGVWTLNETLQTLERRAGSGLPTPLDGPPSRIPGGADVIGTIAKERKPYLTDAAAGDPRLGVQAWATREGVIAFAGHPLEVGDRVVGVMAVFARRVLSDEVNHSLRTVCGCLALAVRWFQLEDEAREHRAAPAARRGE